MKSVRYYIDKYALPGSMALGIVGYKLFCPLAFLLPPLIFLMLFFTFCKVNPLDLRLHKWHWVVLAAQIALTLITYYLLGLFACVSEEVRQGLMLCFLMPTATAAPIIAGKLGGSIQNLTTFTLLSNLATAIIVPIFFPIVNPAAEMTFWYAALLILRKVGPLLLGPFIAAWILRLAVDGYYKCKKVDKSFHLSPRVAQCPFYIWAGTLVLLMANITDTLLNSDYSGWNVFWLTVGSIFCCVIQFFLGRLIGLRWPAGSHGMEYQDVVINPDTAPKDKAGISRITAGQAFGQKNTTLAIWMAQTYLLPLSAIGAAAYIIWQNNFNAWQLARAAKRPI